jgi:acetoin utilization protein AcuB
MIGTFMVSSVKSVAPEAGLAEARELMGNLGIRHLPVISSGKLVGIITQRDLAAPLNYAAGVSLTVGDVMVRDVYVASPTTPLSEVAGEMARNKMGSAVIVDSKDRVVGIFTTTDALEILSELGEETAIEDFLDDDFLSYSDDLSARR